MKSGSWLVIAALALGGCFVPGSVERAETLGKGNFQVSIEPGAAIVAAEGTGVGLPTFHTSFRYGISERFDIGGRVGTSGGRLLTKVLLTKTESTGPRLALAPNLGGFALGLSSGEESVGSGYLDVVFPVLLGVPVKAHELTLGPRVHDTMFFAGAGGDTVFSNIFYLGSSIGFSIQAGKKFAILPEVLFEYPIVASAGASGADTESAFIQADGILIGINLGFQIAPRGTRNTQK